MGKLLLMHLREGGKSSFSKPQPFGLRCYQGPFELIKKHLIFSKKALIFFKSDEKTCYKQHQIHPTSYKTHFQSKQFDDKNWMSKLKKYKLQIQELYDSDESCS